MAYTTGPVKAAGDTVDGVCLAAIPPGAVTASIPASSASHIGLPCSVSRVASVVTAVATRTSGVSWSTGPGTDLTNTSMFPSAPVTGASYVA